MRLLCRLFGHAPFPGTNQRVLYRCRRCWALVTPEKVEAMRAVADDDLVCIFGMPMPHPKPELPCWYCGGKDGDGQPYDPKVHHGWNCEACDERRAYRKGTDYADAVHLEPK